MINALDRYKQWTHAVVGMVNATRRSDATQVRARYLLPSPQRQELWSAARRIVERGLAHATSGEISQRMQGNRVAITGLDADLGQLTERDIVIGNSADGAMLKAARHSSWHQAIYSVTEAGAVVFCQPPYALALANAGRLPRGDCIDVFAAIGGVQLVADTASLTAHAATARSLLIPQIGVLVWGSSVHDAVVRAEALEFAAHVTVVAALLR